MMTNYEKIKSMNIDEMAEFLTNIAGSAGKASERERADYAVAKADDYRKRVEELEKIDLLR